jgi:phytoene dehydrogenase-like protein
MAKLRKWRVLVLERHFKIGGFTHTFTRPGGWSWDVGLHYVGDMGEGMLGRQLSDFITENRVKWNPLPDVRLCLPESRSQGVQRRSEFPKHFDQCVSSRAVEYRAVLPGLKVRHRLGQPLLRRDGDADGTGRGG